MARPRTEPGIRFEIKFVPEPNSGCWLWIGTKSPKSGYGLFRYYATENHTGAHRAAWTLFRGPIPEGLNVCHRCDNRLCVNPDHLFLGTYSDNMKDAAIKGRMNWKPNSPPRKLPRGEQHHASKLLPGDIAEIRNSQETLAILSARYGVTKITISRIKRKLIWRHIL